MNHEKLPDLTSAIESIVRVFLDHLENRIRRAVMDAVEQVATEAEETAIISQEEAMVLVGYKSAVHFREWLRKNKIYHHEVRKRKPYYLKSQIEGNKPKRLDKWN